MSPSVLRPEAVELSLLDLVALTRAVAPAAADLSRLVRGVALFDEAEPGDLTFLSEAGRRRLDASTDATACFVGARYAGAVRVPTVALLVDDPEAAFATALSRMFAFALDEGSLFAARGVSPGANVHPEARLEPDVVVDPGALIGPHAEIGAGTSIAANAVIGPGVRIGRNCRVGAHATIAHALIGNRVRLRPGARIGQSGGRTAAGAPAAAGVGRLIIQDDVEIGANSVIGRGYCRDTVIGEGTVIGALAVIEQDVRIGRKCWIGAQAFVGAATELGDFARTAAQTGLDQGLDVGFGAEVLPQSGVGADIPARMRYAGSPARPLRRWLRALAIVDRLAGLGTRGGRERG